MQDLMPPINTQDSIFHDGDPTTGQLGTIVTALWLNNVQSATRDVQLEIKNVLAKAGIQPDPKKTNQLEVAISQIIGSGNYASTAYVDNGLNKKIDKASISGVLGNDNNKVPSLHLLATELGKKQPAGNYQPAGDYATNAALSNGLALKLDKTSIAQSTGTSTTQVMSQNAATKYFLKDRSYGIGTPPNSAVKFELTASQKICGLYSYTNVYSGNEASSFYGFSSFFNADHGFMLHGRSLGSKQLILAKFIENSSVYDAEIYHSLNTTADRNGNLKVSGVADHLSDCRVGIPLPWPQWWVPTGYLACNGQSFDKAVYPLLAMAYPSGTLPDLRGEFIRGLDAGRNVDSGRSVLSAQGDAMRRIAGNLGLHDNGLFSVASGVFSGVKKTTYQIEIENETENQNNDVPFRSVNFDTGAVVPTANENRPRNIAFLYIVRAA